MPEAPRERLPESVVTPPSDWQPHPERWSSHDDESTELEVTELLAALCRALQPDFVLETGTAFGQTTLALADALHRNGQGELYTVDRDPGRQARVQAQVPAVMQGRVHFVNAHSEEWQPPGGVRFGLAFVDCDFMRRPEVFEHFRPWFEPGAIVAFHDIAPSFHEGPHGYGAGLPRLLPLVDDGSVRLIALRSPRGLALAEVL